MLISSLDAPSQEYRRTKKSRIYSYLFLPTAALAVLGLPLYFMWGTSPSAWAIIGFLLLLLVVGCALSFGLIDAAKSCFIINEQGLQAIDVGGARALAVDEIRGYRIDPKTSSTFIYAKDTTKAPLYFDSGTERYTEIQRWLAARCPDLNHKDAEDAQAQRQQSQAEVIQSPSLGNTPTERTQTLGQLRKLATWLNVAGGGVGMWLWLPPEPDEWAIMAGLLVPLLTVAALWRWPNTLRLDGDKDNGYPSLFVAFLGPSAGLIVGMASYYELVSHAPLWPLAGAAAAGTAVLLAIGSRRFLWHPKPAIGLAFLVVLLALAYGYGASSVVNVQYDTARATNFTPRVLEKHTSKGKYQNFYYLKLVPWGPFTATNEISVSYHYYLLAQPGQPVTIALRPGRLGVPWFRIEE